MDVGEEEGKEGEPEGADDNTDEEDLAISMEPDDPRLANSNFDNPDDDDVED